MYPCHIGRYVKTIYDSWLTIYFPTPRGGCVSYRVCELLLIELRLGLSEEINAEVLLLMEYEG